MLLRLLLLLVLLPLVELALLLYLADLTSWQIALGVVLGTAVVGGALAKWQGMNAWRRARRELAHGRLPAGPVFDAVLLLLAGVLLITPGMLTDAIGAALLLPPTRLLMKVAIVRRLRGRFVVQEYDSFSRHDLEPHADDRTVEGRFTEPRGDDSPHRDDEPPRLP